MDDGPTERWTYPLIEIRGSEGFHHITNGARHGAFLHILILHQKLGTTLGTGFKVDDVIYENAKDDDDFKMRSRRTVKKSFFSIYLPCHPSANLKKRNT